MKKITIILLTLICLNSFSQNKNFTIENDLLTWKYVFSETYDSSLLKNKPRLEFITDSTGTIKKGLASDRNVKDEYTANFRIETRENRYRVIVNNLRFYNTTQIEFDMFSSSVHDYPMEKFWIRNNGAIRAKYWGVSLTDILNNDFIKLFTLQTKVEKEQDDW